MVSFVQPSCRKKSAAAERRRQQIQNRPAFSVFCRREHACGLIHHNVKEPSIDNFLPLYCDLAVFRIILQSAVEVGFPSTITAPLHQTGYFFAASYSLGHQKLIQSFCHFLHSFLRTETYSSHQSVGKGLLRHGFSCRRFHVLCIFPLTVLSSCAAEESWASPCTVELSVLLSDKLLSVMPLSGPLLTV